MTQCEAAGLLGISSSTLCKLFKNRNDFKHDFFTNENSNRKRKGCGKDGEMKATLKDWFTHVREKDARLNGPCLREKAEQLARKMGKPEFKATEGWCNRWIKRENIVFKTPKGKAGDADVSAVHSWLKEQWPILISEYSPSDVYNADESGLYYRALPKASYVFKNENARGCKIAKDGITILCCVSMTDEKENLLVIGKSAAPRCFKNVKKLPFEYRSNKTAWMTSYIFSEWLTRWDRTLKRDILLLVDNCTAHPQDVRLKHKNCVLAGKYDINSTTVRPRHYPYTKRLLSSSNEKKSH